MNNFLFNRVAIIGLGLIGGSVAAAIKRAGLAQSIVGYAVGGHGQQALDLGLVDDVAQSVADAANGADLIVIATPVTTMIDVFANVASVLSDECIVTDCASTKCSVIAAARQQLGNRFDQYLPGHPISGSEFSGPSAARAGLFDNKLWLFTPSNPAQQALVAKLAPFVECLGARSNCVDSQEHDAMFAEYSHAPHALVYAMCLAVADGPFAAKLSEFAGAGFRDTTRIGATSASLWTDILLDNTEQVRASMARVSQAIAEFDQVLASGDRAALLAMISRASVWRAKLEPESKPASPPSGSD